MTFNSFSHFVLLENFPESGGVGALADLVTGLSNDHIFFFHLKNFIKYLPIFDMVTTILFWNPFLHMLMLFSCNIYEKKPQLECIHIV